MKEITYEDLVKANEGLKTTPIERWDKNKNKKVSEDYIDVAQRVKAFRRVYPMGFIETNVIDAGDGDITMKTKVGYYTDDGQEVVLSTGMANEVQSASVINKTSYIEVCETSAVGRALGMAGFGIDAGIASADEMNTALRQQEAQETDMTETIADSTAAVTKLGRLIREVCELDPSFKQDLKSWFGVEKPSDVKKEDFNEISQLAQARLDILKGGQNE